MYLALDEKTNDIIKGDTGPVRVDEGRYTVQQVRCALQTILGEYLPNPTIGFVALEDFKRKPDLLGLESRAREIILGTKGVSTIVELDLTLDNRHMVITFTATTEYGVIYQTVPWGLNDF